MRLSFIIPYYNNSHHLGRQLRLWGSYDHKLRNAVEFIIVDDGSPAPLALESCPGLNLSIYRIQDDVGWNNGGARNLGVEVASSPWVFLSDIDHFVSSEMCLSMLGLDLADHSVYYTFQSNRDGRPQPPPPNIFLISRERFLELGGYDEDLSGRYGGEDILLRIMMHKYLRHVETSLTLDAPDATVYDYPAPRGDRTTLHINDKKIRDKLQNEDYRPGRRLRFRWKPARSFHFRPSENGTTTEDGATYSEWSATEQRLYREANRLADIGQLSASQEALQQLLIAPGTFSQRALLHNDLGVLMVLQGQRGQAQSQFQSALQLDPNFEAARRNMAMLHGESSVVPDSERKIDDQVASRGRRVVGSEKLRIVIVSLLFNWPSEGGGNMHTVGLGEALVEDGHEVYHIFARSSKLEVGSCDDSHPLEYRVLEFSEEQLNAAELQRAYANAVRDLSPDLVLITDAWNAKPLLAEAVAEFPYVLRFDALECICPLNNIRLLPVQPKLEQCHLSQLSTPDTCAQCVRKWSSTSGLRHEVERTLSGVAEPTYHARLLKALREAWAVMAVNPTIATLLEPYSGRVLSVPSGIDEGRFANLPARQASNGVATIFFAGSALDPIKGFTTLHAACEKLWNQRQDFELIVTADPPRRVDQFTWCVGWHGQQQLAKQFAASDVVVIPSVCQESIPLVAVEAMAAACPVVASRIGGLPFTVVEGTTGLLFEPGDIDDLAIKLNGLLDAPERRASMGMAGRARFLSHYTWQSVMNRHYRPFLREFIHSRSPSPQ